MLYIKDNKGITLPIVLLVLAVLSIFGMTTLFITSSQAKLNYKDDTSKQALDYAEAGYNAYLWHLNDDVNFYSTEKHNDMMNKPIEFKDGYYMLEVTKPSDIDRFVTIKSTGWTKENPNNKRTIVAKIRKKQFVHHVYVSNDDGEGIWWTTGDESHGPYHTNKDLYIQGKPVFYDTVSFSGNFFPGDKRPYNFTYNPDFKIKQPKQPEKIGRLEFPTTNQYLKQWAEKDNMVFYGRTCIYLDGDKVKIRNGNAKQEAIQIIPISNIKNKVIYIDNDTEESKWKNIKFDLGAGNIFISGRLEGQLTIAAANNIYITATDPTNWYDEEDEKYQNPPTKYPQDSSKVYGITYVNTKFNENKSKDILSYEDKEKGIWTRDANGKDMLGLVAQNDILILHYGWPRYWNGTNDKYDKSYWNYRWKNKKKENFTYDLAPQNITIHAHLFALEGGFGYEGHNQGGSRGNITLWGNITQNKRKAVGLVNGVGYKKRYAHDPRMFYDYPPHVLEPTNVGWEVHDWREIYEHVKEKTKGDDTH